MPSIFKLKNQIKHYAWGDPSWIPDLLGIGNPEKSPFAEMWMGVHPEGPSVIEAGGRLDALIAQDTLAFMGKSAAARFGGLPFLFKVLAAGKPLSIQAHPSREQAAQGFARENSMGIPLDAPERNYKDDNHKPEIICALTAFKAMAGFRGIAEIRSLLDAFGLPELDSLRESPDLRAFLQTLFDLPADTREKISVRLLEQKQNLILKQPAYTDIWETAASFAELYSGDPAVLSPLYLNLVHLAPGEAMFLPAGILHAYVHGLGVELMANSDNVLRGGLTPKHVDVPELMNCLRFTAYKPEILKNGLKSKETTSQGSGSSLESGASKYPSQCEEFALSVVKGDLRLPENGPFIIIVAEGFLTISGENDEKTSLKKGESAFIAAENAGKLGFSGNYTAYMAGLGSYC
jgi:mannose-6-phosphate isomerase